MKPDFFLFENVKGLWKTARHRAFFEELKASIQAAEYSTTNCLINALAYGAPQEDVYKRQAENSKNSSFCPAREKSRFCVGLLAFC